MPTIAMNGKRVKGLPAGKWMDNICNEKQGQIMLLASGCEKGEGR